MNKNILKSLIISFVLGALSSCGGGPSGGPPTCSTHNPGQADRPVECRLAICACEAQAVGYPAKCMVICAKHQPYSCQQNPPSGPVWTVSNLPCSACTGDAGMQTCQ